MILGFKYFIEFRHLLRKVVTGVVQQNEVRLKKMVPHIIFEINQLLFSKVIVLSNLPDGLT